MALKDCLLVIEEGSMHEVLEQALTHLEAGVAKSKQGVLREALMMIEEAYPSEKIKAVNHFMQNVEERGGEFETSVSLLLSDKCGHSYPFPASTINMLKNICLPGLSVPNVDFNDICM